MGVHNRGGELAKVALETVEEGELASESGQKPRTLRIELDQSKKLGLLSDILELARM